MASWKTKRSWSNHNLLSSKRICVIDRKLICYCMSRGYGVWFLTWIFSFQFSVPVIIYQDLVFLMFCRNHFANLSISTQWSTYLLYGMMRIYQSRHDHNLKSCLIIMFHICVLAVKLLCKIICIIPKPGLVCTIISSIFGRCSLYREML